MHVVDDGSARRCVTFELLSKRRNGSDDTTTVRPIGLRLSQLASLAPGSPARRHVPRVLLCEVCRTAFRKVTAW